MRARVAFVGGGQLAQMIGEAGACLDLSFRSASSEGSCAFSTCEAFTQSLISTEVIEDFLDGIDVFTFESEHEGLDIADTVAAHSIPIRPSASFVELAGDRLKEKTFLNCLSIPVAEFCEINPTFDREHLEQYLVDTLATHTLSDTGIVVKTRRGGYDGKGQWVLLEDDDIAHAAREIHPLLQTPGCIVEGLVDFSLECSILAARSLDGDIAHWPLTHNIHRDSILRFSFSPITMIDNVDEIEKQARTIAETILSSRDYVGTIAVECFVTSEGLVVNEIAPRVHNSGHWTIEGSRTSQFEQHARAITGMNLGDTTTSGFSAMINLVGRGVDEGKLASLDKVSLHWYGKEVRSKRKVGHITVVGVTPTERDELIQLVLTTLELSEDDV